MSLLISALLVILLLIIFYQDLKYRAVTWIVFPCVYLIILIFNSQKNQFVEIISTSMINCIFLVFLIIALSCYFSFKEKRIINIFHNYLGIGDVLFLMALSVYFSPLNFILFFILSSIVVLVITVVYNKFFKQRIIEIPYAGFQALIFFLVHISNIYFVLTDFFNDSWLLQIIL